MAEAPAVAAIVLRLLQYAAAAVLMGSSLFFLYALPAAGRGWVRGLLAGGGVILAFAALLSIPAQACILAGSVAEGLTWPALSAVTVGMDLGKAALLRTALAALAAVLVLTLKPSRRSWAICAALGAMATASFAWMGHGAATDGPDGLVHLVSDILHGWAAAIWIGALVVFLLLLRRPEPSPDLVAALHRFSGVGTALVAVLAATGVINGLFLVGYDRLSGLWMTPYGRLLSLKLLLFVAMLALAAANRLHLTPLLARGSGEAIPALRRSVAVETAIGAAVLALVAWFGTLAPPASL